MTGHAGTGCAGTGHAGTGCAGTGRTRWLLTLIIEVELRQLAVELEPFEVRFEDSEPVPLGSGEQVVGCWGPVDLPGRLRQRPHPAVLAVHPDSPMQLFS